MRKFARILSYLIAFLGITLVFVLGWLAHFKTEFVNGKMIDGLGRELSLAPNFIRLIFNIDRFYPGVGWAVVDIVFFFSVLGISAGLIYLGGKLKSEKV